MKISIASDSHDNWANLEKVIEISNKEECQYLLFAGDLIAPPGIAVLEKFNEQVKFVWGNNEGEKVGITRKLDASKNIELCGDIYKGQIDGVRVFMNHYPEIVELAAKSGEYNLCIYGHTHEYDERKIGDATILNPGEVQGYMTGKASFVVFDTGTTEIKKVDL